MHNILLSSVVYDEYNLRTLVNNTDDPIWLIDTQYTILECNISFSNWVSHFIGTPLVKGDNVLYNGINQHYLDKFAMCYQLALSGKSFTAVEDFNLAGHIHYARVIFNPVVKDGGVVAVSCYARDITEHRKHLNQIEQQNKALRQIAFLESHKIRGPIATILGLGQFFNTQNPSDPANVEIIEGIIHTSTDLDIIIHEVVHLINSVEKEFGIQ